MLDLINLLRAKLEKVPREGHYGGDQIKGGLASVFDQTSAMFSKNAPYKKYTSADFLWVPENTQQNGIAETNEDDDGISGLEPLDEEIPDEVTCTSRTS